MKLPIFTFYLNFVSLGFDKLYQIAEPMGFDASNFVLMQNPNRFSRDISFGNNKSDLRFIEGNFELGANDQIKDQNGTISKYLDMGLNWILESDLQFGYESKIEFIIKKDGLSFTTGLLDSAKRKTDSETFYSCAIIQNNVQADYKRHLDDNIDLFGTKNYLNETITPVQTLDFLRKAISINKYSKLITPQTFGIARAMFGNDMFILNPAVQLIEYGVENTYLPIAEDYIRPISIDGLNETFNRKIILKAKRVITNLKIKTSDLKINIQNAAVTGDVRNFELLVQIHWGNGNVHGANPQYTQTYTLLQVSIDGDSDYEKIINNEFTIPYLAIGQQVWYTITVRCD